MDIKIKKLTNTAVIPTLGSKDSAGVDLSADILDKILIKPHETVKISTGLAMALPEGTFGAIFARSGIATKESLRPANCVGVIDRDYRGEIIVALHNDGEEIRIIEPGQRIAQLVVIPYISINFIETEELDNTERGTGGFGSTGVE